MSASQFRVSRYEYFLLSFLYSPKERTKEKAPIPKASTVSGVALMQRQYYCAARLRMKIDCVSWFYYFSDTYEHCVTTRRHGIGTGFYNAGHCCCGDVYRKNIMQMVFGQPAKGIRETPALRIGLQYSQSRILLFTGIVTTVYIYGELE